MAIDLFENGSPSSAKAAALLAAAREKGLVLLSCGVNGNVIRFLPPPLTIAKETLDDYCRMYD